KGTQAKIIAEATGLTHVSSGDLFRENIKQKTALGKLAQSFITRGDLVPDDVTISMVRERISRPDCQAGALLDGFPRTPAQAAALEKMLAEFGGQVDHVPFITTAPEILAERLGGRWTCRSQGHVFHEKFNPPVKSGVCDFDGSDLYQRDDDKSETVARRIRVYFEQTAPLIAYYRERGVLSEVDGGKAIEAVTTELLRIIGKP
ncbi:MAG: adenylate kinase, partial [Chloroflexi bacterium]|nr:adenylate kinase [Chloroflexota bacterium]